MSTIQPDRRANARGQAGALGRRARHGETPGAAERRVAGAAAGRRSGASDRRSREHLRELCDEVLASYRVAVADEPLSAADRAEASRVLAAVAPLPKG